MKDFAYLPIIKTGDAELRGIENLSKNIKDSMMPLFELTKSRKTPTMDEGDIYRRLQKIEEIYGKRPFILDLTGEPKLSNEQIRYLHDNNNGYKHWVAFLSSLKNRFPSVIPVVQISDEGINTAKEFYDRIKAQVKMLCDHFDLIAYRFSLWYEDFEKDLESICNVKSSNLVCIIDGGYIPQEKAGVYSTSAINVIKKMKVFPVKMILAATSVPQNPIEHGEDDRGEYRLEEHFFYEEVKVGFKTKIIYGDYATIHPTRSSQAGGNGWVPRIDIPTKETIFYRRSRKDESEISYTEAYTRVAELIVENKRYKEVKRLIGDCWGTEQIEMAAQGLPPKLSPSFWISVRMNIHMTIRMALLSNT